MVSASEALLDVLEEHPAVVSVRAAVHPSANNFFRFFFIVIFSILYSYFDICFGWHKSVNFCDTTQIDICENVHSLTRTIIRAPMDNGWGPVSPY